MAAHTAEYRKWFVPKICFLKAFNEGNPPAVICSFIHRSKIKNSSDQHSLYLMRLWGAVIN